MIEVIFFDFDGVLVESVDVKTEAFARLFRAEGSEAVEAVVNYHLQNTGVSRFDKFRYIYREILKRPLTEAEFRRLCDSFAEIVVNEVVKAPYVDGTPEFLRDYSEKYRCFVTSATPQEEMKRIICERNMSQFFRGVYGAPTPKKDAVRMALEEERVKPSQALYVGDALSDSRAASENGVFFVARIDGNETLFKGIDCPRIRDLTELDTVLDTLWSQAP